MSTVCYSTLFLTYFISEMILGINSITHPLLSKYQLMVLIAIIFPTSCLLCLARPWNLEVLMNRSVLNRRILKENKIKKLQLQYQTMLVSYSRSQAIYTAILINIIRLINLYLSYCHGKDDSLRVFRSLLWNKYGQENTNIENGKLAEVHFNFAMVLICISLIQIGKESPLTTLVYGFFATVRGIDGENDSDDPLPSQHNKYFMCAIVS
jgi:hypothetical protein